VRRGAVLLAGLALLVLALAPAGAPPLRAPSAHAAECTWQRHGKRVVKRVRRHGRVRKIVRWRHWWTCDPVAAAPAEAPVPPPPPGPGETQEPAPEPEANRVSVRSAEYFFVLSRPSVKTGEVTVELNNQGEDAHNLNLRREGESGTPLEIAETASQERTVAHFDLPPGTYRLWCSLPEHDEKGMHTTLVVE
jgi:plastocyanin